MASKRGVVGATKILAQDLARFGILVTCVSPGRIYTEPATGDAKAPLMDIPLGHRGTLFEVACILRTLRGPAGWYVTGRTLHIKGGVVKTAV